MTDPQSNVSSGKVVGVGKGRVGRKRQWMGRGVGVHCTKSRRIFGELGSSRGGLNGQVTNDKTSIHINVPK